MSDWNPIDLYNAVPTTTVDNTARIAAANAAKGNYYANLKTAFGAVGDGVTDDTAALAAAAVSFMAGNSIYMPPGNYINKSEILLTYLTTYPYPAQRWIGAGPNISTITIQGAGVNCFHITGAGSYPAIEFDGFSIFGASNTGRGIYSDTTVYVSGCKWSNMVIQTGWNCIEIGHHFNHILEDIWCLSLNGHGFCIPGGNTLQLRGCRATGVTGNGKAGFRIGVVADLMCCNGIDTGDYWGVFGCAANVTGIAQAGTGTSITLAAGSTFVTNEIVNRYIAITSGTGSGNTGRCTAYNSSTKVATITPANTAPNVTSSWVAPDATSHYSVQDSEVMFQSNQYPFISMYNCNLEVWALDAIRFIQGGTFFMYSGSFVKNSGTYNSCIHYSNPYELSPSGQGNILIAPQFNTAGATRTGGADILVDYDPPELVGICAWPSGATVGTLTNAYYDVGSAGIRRFNNLHARGIHLPKLATADPVDGTGAIWVDAANSHQLKQGT
jgi:hypothetical protein